MERTMFTMAMAKYQVNNCFVSLGIALEIQEQTAPFVSSAVEVLISRRLFTSDCLPAINVL